MSILDRLFHRSGHARTNDVNEQLDRNLEQASELAERVEKLASALYEKTKDL